MLMKLTPRVELLSSFKYTGKMLKNPNLPVIIGKYEKTSADEEFLRFLLLS